jgi:transcription initiation factor TFIIB
VIRFSSALDLKQDVIKGTLLVSRKVTESGILAGKSPITLVAACLFFVSSLSKDPKSAKEIAGIAGCTEATLRNAYKLLYEAKEEISTGLVMPLPISALP